MSNLWSLLKALRNLSNNELVECIFWSFHVSAFFIRDNGLQSSLWSYVEPVMKYTFQYLWVIPLFWLSKILNCIWFVVSIVAFFTVFFNHYQDWKHQLWTWLMFLSTVYHFYGQLMLDRDRQAIIFIYLVPLRHYWESMRGGLLALLPP